MPAYLPFSVRLLSKNGKRFKKIRVSSFAINGSATASLAHKIYLYLMNDPALADKKDRLVIVHKPKAGLITNPKQQPTKGGLVVNPKQKKK